MSFSIAAVLEYRNAVAIDNDRKQFPLAAGRVGHVQHLINKEHKRLTRKKESRRKYDASFPHRFLDPLDVNIPWGSYAREQKKEEAKQQKIDEVLAAQDTEVVALEDMSQSYDLTSVKHSLAESLDETNELLLQLALEQSKKEQEEEARVTLAFAMT